MHKNNTDNIIKFDVDIDEIGTRVDVFLSSLISDVSRTRVQQLIKDPNAVLINGKVSKNSYKLRYSDSITVKIPEAKPLELHSENILLDVPYEDENMLVVNKPAGMLT